MHNIWVRLNSVVFFALSVLIFLATLCSFSTILHTGQPKVSVLKINTLKSLRNHGGLDRALFSFDLQADLTPAFHWNLHQLFVMVVAEYTSEANVLNQVVVWDKNISRIDKADLKLKNEFVKYALIDQGAELRNRTIQLKLLWEHMPITGRVYWGEDTNFKSTYQLPTRYKT